MLPYWALYLIPALAALNAARNRRFNPYARRNTRLDFAWILTIIALTLFIGYRHEVGGDWRTYLWYLYYSRRLDFLEVFSEADPGYILINWVSGFFDWDIYGANLIAGLIFATGLAIFCRQLPRPWLALAVAVPYTVIVVAMGYSRQGVAIGLAMIGLAALERQRYFWFVFWILIGATFHKTSVVLLPLGALSASRNRILVTLWIGASFVMGYVAFLESSIDRYVENYLEAGYQSSGAFIRLTMNLVPAAILLYFRKRFIFNENQRRLWISFALISIAAWAAFFLMPSSTAIDRIALYMLPLQLIVFSHAPDVLGVRGKANTQWVVAIIVYYGLVQFVWLFFAGHSFAWLPYQFYLLL